jgi:hypothetical protein
MPTHPLAGNPRPGFQDLVNPAGENSTGPTPNGSFQPGNAHVEHNGPSSNPAQNSIITGGIQRMLNEALDAQKAEFLAVSDKMMEDLEYAMSEWDQLRVGNKRLQAYLKGQLETAENVKGGLRDRIDQLSDRLRIVDVSLEKEKLANGDLTREKSLLHARLDEIHSPAPLIDSIIGPHPRSSSTKVLQPSNPRASLSIT